MREDYRQPHWPVGPFPVHPNGTAGCWKFWCTVWNRHEYRVECSCGWNVQAKRMQVATAAASEHINGLRAKLKGRDL